MTPSTGHELHVLLPGRVLSRMCALLCGDARISLEGDWFHADCTVVGLGVAVEELRLLKESGALRWFGVRSYPIRTA